MNKYITQEDKEQVMKDKIYRETALNALYNEKRNLLAMDADRVANGVQVSIKVIESLPSADRPTDPHAVTYINALENRIRELEADRPQGHYIKGENGEWYCSNCKRIDDKYSVARFCWYCGADMRKGTDDDYD